MKLNVLLLVVGLVLLAIADIGIVSSGGVGAQGPRVTDYARLLGLALAVVGGGRLFFRNGRIL